MTGCHIIHLQVRKSAAAAASKQKLSDTTRAFELGIRVRRRQTIHRFAILLPNRRLSIVYHIGITKQPPERMHLGAKRSHPDAILQNALKPDGSCTRSELLTKLFETSHFATRLYCVAHAKTQRLDLQTKLRRRVFTINERRC